MHLKLIVIFLSGIMLTACGGKMNIQDFKGTSPELVLEDFFTGKTQAIGLFEDRFGKVRAQFTVEITGTWDGTTLTLDEDFIYKDGRTEYRKWEILKTGKNSYQGTTQQIIGIASGQTTGNAFNWKYKFKLTVGDDIWNVSFDDWMFLQDKDTLINKATIYRWGFKIGTVFLTFHKESE